MSGDFLIQAAVFLAAAAIAAPLAKRLNVSSVLGYLAAGVLIGPFGLGFVYTVYQVESILHFAEYGVALLLFLIGLELKPKRLWTMRGTILGLGGAQVVITAIVLTPVVGLIGIPWSMAAFVALALSLSSTAFVLQVLEEKGELSTRHGRAAFSVLLFQDLAAIPLIAAVPLLGAAAAGSTGFSFWAAAQAVGAIALVIIVGRYVLSGLYRLIASTGVREAMTASALLTVIGVVLVMEAAGLSAALGAFIAGALLADSPYRHQIEADIAPFEGLLLGLFFTAVGMGLNLELLAAKPLLIALSVVGLILAKATVLYLLGRWRGLEGRAARRLAIALCQGGEFAFVLFATAIGANVIDKSLAELLTVIVTLSILATPLLLLADDLCTKKDDASDTNFDALPQDEGHVVIAGFGRVGQIVARVLRGKNIPFTALDISAEQVAMASKFGNDAYFGDASRVDILRAAQVDKARAFVLAVDEVDASLRTAEIVRHHFPDTPVFARARNRQHAYRLMDLGITLIRRETFMSTLHLTQDLLIALGYSEAEAGRTIQTFRDFDRQRLYADYPHYTDQEKLQAQARVHTEELEALFDSDADLAEPGDNKAA